MENVSLERLNELIEQYVAEITNPKHLGCISTNEIRNEIRSVSAALGLNGADMIFERIRKLNGLDV